MTVGTGICKYCGQVNTFEYEDDLILTAEESNEEASKVCKCKRATIEREKEYDIKTAKENIDYLFESDFKEATEVLKHIAEAVRLGAIKQTTVKLSDETKCKIKLKDSRTIVTERTDTANTQLETF